MSDFNYFNDVLKRRIADLRENFNKLKAVDSLIGEDATFQKKNEILDIIFVLQDIQDEVLNKSINRLEQSEIFKSNLKGR